MSTAELAASYAALILADDGLDITVRTFPHCARTIGADSTTKESMLTKLYDVGRQAQLFDQGCWCT